MNTKTRCVKIAICAIWAVTVVAVKGINKTRAVYWCVIPLTKAVIMYTVYCMQDVTGNSIPSRKVL